MTSNHHLNEKNYVWTVDMLIAILFNFYLIFIPIDIRGEFLIEVVESRQGSLMGKFCENNAKTFS